MYIHMCIRTRNIHDPTNLIDKLFHYVILLRVRVKAQNVPIKLPQPDKLPPVT